MNMPMLFCCGFFFVLLLLSVCLKVFWHLTNDNQELVFVCILVHYVTESLQRYVAGAYWNLNGVNEYNDLCFEPEIKTCILLQVSFFLTLSAFFFYFRVLIT